VSRPGEHCARLLSALAPTGAAGALLSDPESIARLSAYLTPAEDYPVRNPYGPAPELLAVGPQGACLIASDFYELAARAAECPVELYAAYAYLAAPDPAGRLRTALGAALARVGLAEGVIGIEPGTLPVRIATWLREDGYAPRDVEELVLGARAVDAGDLEAFRRAAAVVDAAQEIVRTLAHADGGLSEVEICAACQVEINRVCGLRVSTFANVAAGAHAGEPPWESGAYRLRTGDLVLSDIAPWVGGVWGDSASTVVVGEPTAEQQRAFDAVRRALELGMSLCRPGATASEVDRQVRDSLSEWGPAVYPHHTGHAIGASWSEEPRIAPYCHAALEEGMVLALEPSLYRPGWGGVRLEHMIVVTPQGGEALTRFEHRL
jgi:Xaa-Pro aminopeptidase